MLYRSSILNYITLVKQIEFFSSKDSVNGLCLGLFKVHCASSCIFTATAKVLLMMQEILLIYGLWVSVFTLRLL